jgi:hypothetical protein
METSISGSFHSFNFMCDGSLQQKNGKIWRHPIYLIQTWILPPPIVGTYCCLYQLVVSALDFQSFFFCDKPHSLANHPNQKNKQKVK